MGEIRLGVGEIRLQKALKLLQCFLYFQKINHFGFIFPKGLADNFRGHFRYVDLSSFVTLTGSRKVGEIRLVYVILRLELLKAHFCFSSTSFLIQEDMFI